MNSVRNQKNYETCAEAHVSFLLECNYRVLKIEDDSFQSTSYGMRPEMNGFSPGLKNMPPECFLPSLRAGRPLRIPTQTKRKEGAYAPSFLLVGVSGFELCYFELYGAFETFVFTKLRFCFIYPNVSNSSFCTIPLKGNLKGKNKGNFSIGTCFLQNQVYTNK